VKPADTKVSRSLARLNIFPDAVFREAATCTAGALPRVVRMLSSPRFSTLPPFSRTRARRLRWKWYPFVSPCSNRSHRQRLERWRPRAGFWRSKYPARLSRAARSSFRSRARVRPARCAPAYSYGDMSPGSARGRACGWRRCFLRMSGELRQCLLLVPASPPFRWTRERSRRPRISGERGVHRAIFSSMT
jgi:hypothetical protein